MPGAASLLVVSGIMTIFRAHCASRHHSRRTTTITGGELVSTGVAKQLGACRGAGPRKSYCNRKFNCERRNVRSGGL